MSVRPTTLGWLTAWHALAAWGVFQWAAVVPTATRPGRVHAWTVVATAWTCALLARPCRRTHRHGWCGCVPSKGRVTQIRARGALAACAATVALWTYVTKSTATTTTFHVRGAVLAALVGWSLVAAYHGWCAATTTHGLVVATVWTVVGVGSMGVWVGGTWVAATGS